MWPKHLQKNSGFYHVWWQLKADNCTTSSSFITLLLQYARQTVKSRENLPLPKQSMFCNQTVMATYISVNVLRKQKVEGEQDGSM